MVRIVFGLTLAIVLLWNVPAVAQHPGAKTLPNLKELHAKYADQGLVIVGGHTPWAEYEKDGAKVLETVEAKGIQYPVAIDHEYLPWLDYVNNAWPTHFVVDQEGAIQLSHTGIGRYQDTEQVIQRLLGLAN